MPNSRAMSRRLAWTARTGVVIRGQVETWDPDNEVADDHIWRLVLGTDLTLLPGLALSVDGRLALPAGGVAGTDVVVHTHGWF